MGELRQVHVPDIGDFKEVPIIEIAVKPGDRVGVEPPLLTLESDKASMDVPSPLRGVVQELKVKAGDKVSEGSVILTLATEAALAQPQRPSPPPKPAAPAAPVAAARAAPIAPGEHE